MTCHLFSRQPLLGLFQQRLEARVVRLPTVVSLASQALSVFS
jgi:hypothetical protein